MVCATTQRTQLPHAVNESTVFQMENSSNSNNNGGTPYQNLGKKQRIHTDTHSHIHF